MEKFLLLLLVFGFEVDYGSVFCGMIIGWGIGFGWNVYFCIIWNCYDILGFMCWLFL